jgi:hypothetical protein
MELCLDSDSERKLRYIEYFMHRVNLLRYYKVTPVVVFDGGAMFLAKQQLRKRGTSMFFIFLFKILGLNQFFQTFCFGTMMFL